MDSGFRPVLHSYEEFIVCTLYQDCICFPSVSECPVKQPDTIVPVPGTYGTHDHCLLVAGTFCSHQYQQKIRLCTVARPSCGYLA